MANKAAIHLAGSYCRFSNKVSAQQAVVMDVRSVTYCLYRSSLYCTICTINKFSVVDRRMLPCLLSVGIGSASG